MDLQPPPRSTNIFVGVFTAAFGVYIMLMAAGVAPMPEDSLHGPAWVGICAGLVFALGGIAVAANAAAGARDDGELPVDAPKWLRFAQSAVAVGVLATLATLATIGTWIAVSGDPRAFSVGGSPVDTSDVGLGIARTVFGLGALLTWLAAIAFAVREARRLLGYRKA